MWGPLYWTCFCHIEMVPSHKYRVYSKVAAVTSGFSDPALLFVTSVLCNKRKAISEKGTQWDTPKHSLWLIYIAISTNFQELYLNPRDKNTNLFISEAEECYFSVQSTWLPADRQSYLWDKVLLGFITRKHYAPVQGGVIKVLIRIPEGNQLPTPIWHIWLEFLFCLFLIFISKQNKIGPLRPSVVL